MIHKNYMPYKKMFPDEEIFFNTNYLFYFCTYFLLEKGDLLLGLVFRRFVIQHRHA